MDIIRKEIEKCNCIIGFNYLYAMHGNGLGTVLLPWLRDEYPDRVFSSHIIYPSEKEMQKEARFVYNTVFAHSMSMDNADMCYVYCNDNIEKHAINLFGKANNQYTPLVCFGIHICYFFCVVFLFFFCVNQTQN